MKSLNFLSKALSLAVIIVIAILSDHLVRAQESKPAISDAQTSLGVQTGHSNIIVAVAVSADGRYVVTRSLDGTARLWETSTGNELRQFDSGILFFFSVAISADNKYVMVGSDVGTVQLWEAATGKVARMLEGHSSTVDSVAFSADSKYALTGSWDKTVRLWEVETGKEVQKFVGHLDRVESIAISADGKYVAAGSKDKMARVWEVSTGKEVQKFVGHSDWIRSVAFSPDDKYLVTGSHDESARVWEIETGKEIQRFKGHSNAVLAATFLPDGRHVLSSGFDATARIWEVRTGKEVRKFETASSKIGAVAISPDSKYLAVGLMSTAITLWDVGTGKEIERFFGYSDSIRAVAISADEKYVLTGSDDNTAHLWEIATGKEVRKFVGHEHSVTSVTFSADVKYVLIGSRDKTARLWDTETGRLVRIFKGHSDEVNSVAISTDGKYVVTGSDDKTARLWESGTGKMLRKFVGHSEKINSVAISSDGKYVATSSDDTTTRLWKTATGAVVRQFIGQVGDYTATLIGSEGPQRKVYKGGPADAHSVAFSPDDKQVLVGGEHGKAWLWEVETDKLVREFDIDSMTIKSVALSADGKYALAGGWDNIAVLWDVKTGKELHRFEGHTNWINSVAISADSKYVITGGSDSTTRIWVLETGKQLCSLTSFSDDNWAVVTPDGHFDASDLEEMKGLHWLMLDDPMRTYPIEIFMRDYYEPRLLPRVLNGEKLITSRQLSSLNRVLPLVKILKGYRQSGSDMVTIEIEVAGATSELQRDKDGRLLETGVYDLRLFRDGQFIGQFSDGEPQKLSPSATEKEKLLAWRKESRVKLDANGKRIIKFENIRLPRSKDIEGVRFSAYAFNEDRVKSQTSRKGFYMPEDLSPLKGRAYVVMFGVNACEAECMSLDYAVNDVRKMQETFVAKLKQSGQYEEVVEIPLIANYRTQPNGKRIVDEKSATKGNLKTVFDLLSGKPVDEKLLAGITNAAKLKQARPEDMLMIFFSSHGDTDDSGNFYIVPYDIGQTRLCGNAGITDEDYKRALARCISSEELSLWLRYVDAGEMMMIVDACHSSAAVQSGEFKPGPMGSRGLGQLAYDKRMKILSATQGDNLAREFKELNQSLLSYMLTKEGIEEERADFKPVDQLVMMTEWLQYGETRVPKWYEDKQKAKAGQQKSSDPKAKSAGQRYKRMRHGDSAREMQIPSLFDFTRKKRDSILFRKAADIKK
ncbi:MAG: caspase family protein [Blastocatellia bacterium]